MTFRAYSMLVHTIFHLPCKVEKKQSSSVFQTPWCRGLLQSRVSNFCLRILQSFASKHIMSASLNNERKLLEELLDFTYSSAAINSDPIFMSTTKSQSCSTLYNNDLPPQYRIFLTSWQLIQERNLNLVYFYKLLKYFSMISKIFFRIICSDLETNLNHLH